MVTVFALALPNDCEAMSARSLETPAMESVERGDDSVTCWRMARMWASWLAINNFVDLSLLDQLTVGVLSDHAATWRCLRVGVICSNTSH